MTDTMSYRDQFADQFALANGYAAQTPQIALPDHPQPPAVPEPQIPETPVYGWVGPSGGKRNGAGHPGWAGLAKDVQGYASALMDQFPGLRFTSGYRDPDHNRAVGGVPTSKHMSGRAVDLVGNARQMYDGAAWAKQHGAKKVLVHNAGSGMHLHVEF